MDNSTALAFCYAQAAGLLQKSFVKTRASLLFAPESLADLWDLLFKEPAPLVPEAMLAQQIEEKASQRFLSQYQYFLNQFDCPPAILTDLLKIFETDYSDTAADIELLRQCWKSIQKCHGDDRVAHEKLFLDEYVIKNIVWSLRLELYYEMPRDQIIQNLFYVNKYWLKFP